MTLAKRTHGFRQIASIRSAQEAAAEIRVQKVLIAQAALERHGSELEARHAGEQQLWTNATSATPMNLPLAAVWAQAVNLSHADLARLRQQLKEADAEVQTAKAEWSLAQAKSEVAKDLLISAIQKRSRQIEELRLTEVEDAFAYKRALR